MEKFIKQSIEQPTDESRAPTASSNLSILSSQWITEVDEWINESSKQLIHQSCILSIDQSITRTPRFRHYTGLRMHGSLCECMMRTCVAQPFAHITRAYAHIKRVHVCRICPGAATTCAKYIPCLNQWPHPIDRAVVEANNTLSKNNNTIDQSTD